ncbi:unnamed protein product [Rhizoctonia solani]|uniref:SP-RING-type domain-containing protein n=1 Tax=Rhizoctonia solani TaxID=456999 RepID=A0A8H3GG31_9AGAM|nr:unnamed protein product [Rhizoctonia solani]
MDEQTTARVIRSLQRIPFTEVRQSVIESMAGDPDIEIQRQTLSLRCPLSQTRIRDPCRFVGCDHFQCFDATSFLLFTHATQMRRSSAVDLRCPICERDVSTDTLAVDLYFDDVLRRVPPIIDEVDLQANGEWSTRDGQHTSFREITQVAAIYSGRITNPETTPGPASTPSNDGNLYPPEVIYVDSRSTLHEITVDRLPENEKDGVPGEDQPHDLESPTWGTHFWSIATAAYDSLHVPLPFPFSFDFWDRNEPSAPTQTINPRENLLRPTTAPNPPEPETPPAPLAQPPLAYHPARPAPVVPPPLVRDPGMGPPPDNRDQGGQLESPCPPPAQPDRGPALLGIIGGVFRFFRGIGFGWSLWILMVLVDVIEGTITIRLSMVLTEHWDFNQTVLSDRIRFVCFTSWWTMAGLLAVIPIELAWAGAEPSRAVGQIVISVFFLTWIFWTAGAGSISTIIWPREGPDCIIENFPYCKYTQGVLGLAWFMWIMVTVQGVYLICQAYKRYKAAENPV